jgi:nucleotide-binding universal stress UspA family protein
MRYRTVLVAYDGSKASQRVLEAAVDFARDGAEVIGVSVRAPTGEDRDAESLTELRDMIATYTGSFGVRLPTELRTGHPAQEILAAARRHRADLIIMGRSDRSAAFGRSLGTTAETVSRHAECSVLIVR